MGKGEEMASKPTPAQLKRLRQVAEGKVYRSGSSWIANFFIRGTNECIPYTMMGRMHKAGWIDVERKDDIFYYDVVLTEAGRRLLGQSLISPPGAA